MGTESRSQTDAAMRKPAQSSPIRPTGPAERGQMTMAMRAIHAHGVAGPKVLRIGKVIGGSVVEERLISERGRRGDVRVGSSHTNLFLTHGADVPESMKLFELVGGNYVLNLTHQMTGRVALATGIADLAQLYLQGALKAGEVYPLKLTDDARGKVVLGETTFLFQFVAAPAVQGKAQLPLAVVGGLASKIDWGFTVIAAFSFLLHFGFAVAANGELFEPIVDDDAQTAALIQQTKDRPVLPVEEPKLADKDDKAKDAKVDKDRAKDAAKDAAKDKVAVGPKKSASDGAGRPSPSFNSTATKALSSELDALELKALGALGPGKATASIFKPGASATESELDAISKRVSRVGVDGDRLKTDPGGSIGPVGPGTKDLSKIGETGPSLPGAPSVKPPGDTSMVLKVPTVDATPGRTSGASNVKDADSVIASNRYKFKSCYNKAISLDSTAAGTVRVAVKVGEGGEVTSATVVSSDAPAGLTACVVGAFNSMKFAEPEGGSATFTVPVVLSARK